MKKAITIALSILIFSCKKEDKPSLKIDFDGRWVMVSDTTRYINVTQVNDSTVDVVFPRSISGPSPKPITVTYKATKRNDTVFCISGNIYPSCYFTEQSGIVRGYIEEWLIPSEKGKLKEIKR